MTCLYKATTELHHSAELHPFGQRMATGTLTRAEWANWLGAMLQIHLALDPYLPPSLKRAHDLQMDLAEMLPLRAEFSPVAAGIVAALTDVELIGGLCYILSGANLKGGQVIRKRIEPLGFPCHHLTFLSETAAADKWLKQLREVPALAKGAQDAFAAVLVLMTEIDSEK